MQNLEYDRKTPETSLSKDSKEERKPLYSRRRFLIDNAVATGLVAGGGWGYEKGLREFNNLSNTDDARGNWFMLAMLSTFPVAIGLTNYIIAFTDRGIAKSRAQQSKKLESEKSKDLPKK